MRPDFARPYAIAMWDFSWLERRWPGAGFEDWDEALSGLTERGYDAVRIDAFPHLLSAGPHRVWELEPLWTQQSWGAQSRVWVQVMPALLDFLRAARRHGVAVALSTWFRDDADHTRTGIQAPDDLARIWVDTLRAVDQAGLLDTVLYVDLCNEFPLEVWSPFMYPAPGSELLSRAAPHVEGWMRESVAAVRAKFPDLDLTFSLTSGLMSWSEQNVGFFDVLEPHVWMASDEFGDYYEQVGYAYERFEPTGYDNVVRRGRAVYDRDPARWEAAMFAGIDSVAAWSRATHLPLYTTEGWALVDYKDWPGLEWDWIKDLNAKAVARAAATGRWVGLATSNFCAPQFVGMWRDVTWHRELTALIRSSPVDDDLRRAAAPAGAARPLDPSTSEPGA